MTTIRTRFYDNERSILNAVPLYAISRLVETVLADDKLPNPLLKKSDVKFYRPSFPEFRIQSKRYMARYADAFPGNAFVNRVIMDDDVYDKKMPCGMTVPQIIDLMLWCIRVTEAGDEAYVFLDWDRTLSCVEGLYFKSYLIDELGVPVASYLEYIMGGPPRFHLIKLLFAVFRAFGVHYFIITNNGMAAATVRGGDRAYFLEVIRMIDPTFVNKQLIYTGLLRNKAEFFLEDWVTNLSRIGAPLGLTMKELHELRDEICRLRLSDFPSDKQQQQLHHLLHRATIVHPVPRRPSLS